MIIDGQSSTLIINETAEFWSVLKLQILKFIDRFLSQSKQSSLTSCR